MNTSDFLFHGRWSAVTLPTVLALALASFKRVARAEFAFEPAGVLLTVSCVVETETERESASAASKAVARTLEAMRLE